MLMKLAKKIVISRIRLSLLASLIASGGLLSTTAYAIPFSAISQVYFFGDSLTDSGFNNLMMFGDDKKAPTFTTYGGYTWAQYLARDIKGYTLPSVYPAVTRFSDEITNNTTPTNGENYGAVDPVLTGINYACGGSKTNSATGLSLLWAPSLHQQVDKYIESHPKADPSAIYFIWSGANDLLAIIDPIPTEKQMLQAADTATTNIAAEVARLSERGAKRIVVMSLPNIGSTPLVMDLAKQDPTLPGRVKNLSFTFDTMLNAKISVSIKKYGVKILYINTYALLDEVVRTTKAGLPYVVEGRSFKFENYTSTSCGEVVSLFCPDNGIKNYVFADNIHPTDMTHKVLSLEVEKRIKSWV